MNLLYVVQLEVEAISDKADVLSTLGGHLANWLEFKIGHSPSDELLSGNGFEDVSVNNQFGDTTKGSLTWRALRDEKWLGSQVELRQETDSANSALVTSITVLYMSPKLYSLRVAVGRESSTEILSKVESQPIFTPGFLVAAVRDESLGFSSHGQSIDTQFVKIDSQPKLELLFESLRGRRLLPFLLIDTVRASRYVFAKKAVKPLLGMAHVFVLPNSQLLGDLAKEFPEYEVPFAGAKLIWPENGVRPTNLDEDDLDWAEGSVQILKNALYAASAITRNRNYGWVRAEQAAKQYEFDARLEQLNKELLQASAEGNKSAEVELLQSALKARTAEYNELADLHADYLDSFGALDERDARIRMLEDQVAHWRSMALARFQNSQNGGAKIPNTPDGDFSQLFDALTLESAGRLLFTANALAQWNKAGRPEAEKMRESLIKLAEASKIWADKEGRLGVGLENWLDEKFGLNLALQDEPLRASKKHLFDFEGVTLDRTPHIKVKDATDPQHVARIYFAIDSSQFRFIVDHVGLKLYKI